MIAEVVSLPKKAPQGRPVAGIGQVS